MVNCTHATYWPQIIVLLWLAFNLVALALKVEDRSGWYNLIGMTIVEGILFALLWCGGFF